MFVFRGGILGNFILIGPNEKQILLKRANFEAMNTKKKKERKDFGHFILSLKDNAISIDNFARLVRDFKLKLSDSLVRAIGKAFTVGKNLIDQKELKSFYLKEYPVISPIKEKKSKRGKEDKKGKKSQKDEANNEAPLEAAKKSVKFKDKKTKQKTKLEEIPEILSEEFEFEDRKDNLFQDIKPDFEFENANFI